MIGFLCALFALCTLVTLWLAIICKDWRPVALCTVVTQIVAWVLAVASTAVAGWGVQ